MILLIVRDVYYKESYERHGIFVPSVITTEILYSESKVYKIKVYKVYGKISCKAKVFYFSKGPFSVRVKSIGNTVSELTWEYVDIIDRKRDFVLSGSIKDEITQKLFIEIIKTLPKEWIELTGYGKKCLKFLGLGGM
ncbi:MAG TPA: hypothetical protein ENK81_02945 [Euryarchaeota archaeon]|nr:hypothetical protein [Euryarchaeota archaeon]